MRAVSARWGHAQAVRILQLGAVASLDTPAVRTLRAYMRRKSFANMSGMSTKTSPGPACGGTRIQPATHSSARFWSEFRRRARAGGPTRRPCNRRGGTARSVRMRCGGEPPPGPGARRERDALGTYWLFCAVDALCNGLGGTVVLVYELWATAGDGGLRPLQGCIRWKLVD